MQVCVYYRYTIFVQTDKCITEHHVVVLRALVSLNIHNTYAYVCAEHSHQRRLANATGPAQHTLVGRGLTVGEPVAHALFQHGPALETLRGADVVYEHRLQITFAALSTGPLLCCSVITCAAGCYTFLLPLLDLDKILALEAEHLAVFIENHSQPTAHYLALDRAKSAIVKRRLAQPLHAHAHHDRRFGLAVCPVPRASPKAVFASGSDSYRTEPGAVGSGVISAPKHNSRLLRTYEQNF